MNNYSFSTINFSEVRDDSNYGDLSDTETMVWVGLELTEKDLPEVNKFFHECGLIPEEKNFIGADKILGNVLGNEGRTDYLLRFDCPEILPNPLVRLQIRGLKWTSDFIVNYKKDYKK